MNIEHWPNHQPAHLAARDQAHAVLRDIAQDLRQGCHTALVHGHDPLEVVTQMTRELITSPYTRDVLACLLGIALVDLDVAQYRRGGYV